MEEGMFVEGILRKCGDHKYTYAKFKDIIDVDEGDALWEVDAPEAITTVESDALPKQLKAGGASRRRAAALRNALLDDVSTLIFNCTGD